MVNTLKHILTKLFPKKLTTPTPASESKQMLLTEPPLEVTSEVLEDNIVVKEVKKKRPSVKKKKK